MKQGNAVADLAACYAHAMYEGFPMIEYQSRDWSEKNTVIMAPRTRIHSGDDIEVYAMFVQAWASTALGFGGLGGQAITEAYTTVLRSNHRNQFCVYFGGRFAYTVTNPSPRFFDDIKQRRMASCKDRHWYESTEK